MIPTIVLDGISSPGPPFGLWLFLGFELLTILVEFIVCAILIEFFGDKRMKSVELDTLFIIVVIMNFASALIAFPIWQNLHIGGL